jgi:hypothetical protein
MIAELEATGKNKPGRGGGRGGQGGRGQGLAEVNTEAAAAAAAAARTTRPDSVGIWSTRWSPGCTKVPNLVLAMAAARANSRLPTREDSYLVTLYTLAPTHLYLTKTRWVTQLILA